MSALDFVTVRYPIPHINHEQEHYQTKDMALWGEYLVDETGKLFRREYPGDYQPDDYTGQFEMVGSESGNCTLTFEHGQLKSWIYMGRLVVYVLTRQERHYEDPDDYDVLGVFTSLESAKEWVTVGEWMQDDSSAETWSNDSDGTSWTITPTGLIEAGTVTDNPSSEG